MRHGKIGGRRAGRTAGVGMVMTHDPSARTTQTAQHVELNLRIDLKSALRLFGNIACQLYFIDHDHIRPRPDQQAAAFMRCGLTRMDKHLRAAGIR